MNLKLSRALRNRLLKELRGKSESASEVDELFNILLQLTLAIMLIFMMAFFLYKLNTGDTHMEMRQLQQELADARRQQLQAVLDRIETAYRERYALTKFEAVDADNKRIYRASEVIVDGKIGDLPLLREAFVEGGRAAYTDYARPGELEEQWLRSVRDQVPQLTGDEVTFVREEIARRLQALKHGVTEVQLQAAAAIQQYLVRHPDEVEDARIHELLVRLSREDDPKLRRLLVTELNSLLKQYAFARLRQESGTPLLEDLR